MIGAFQEAFYSAWFHFLRRQVGAVRQVEFFVRLKARAGKVGRADNRGNGCKTLEASAAVEDVALGMQEPPRVETDLYVFLAQEGDEVFDESQRFLVEGFLRKVADESFDWFYAHFT